MSELESAEKIAKDIAKLERNLNQVSHITFAGKEKEVYERAVETLGPENRYTLKSMYGVASSYSDIGDYENALKWHEDCYRLRVKNFGCSDGDTLLSLNALARTYYNLEMYYTH